MKTVDDINREAQTDLRERVKELSCLYNIAHLASQKDITMSDMLKGVVEGLPSAWLYPEAACARVVLDGRSHCTNNYRRLCHRQTVPIVINGKLRGYIEVGYSDKRPRRDHGPFLNEERNLLEAVAKEVAIVIMRKEAEQDRSKLEEQLRHADRLATVGQLAAGVAHELNVTARAYTGVCAACTEMSLIYDTGPGGYRQDTVHVPLCPGNSQETFSSLPARSHPKKGR